MRQVMFHKATFTDPDGSVGGLVGVMLDITERTRMETTCARPPRCSTTSPRA